MDDFGIRFRVDDVARFGTLRKLILEIQRDKNTGEFRDPCEWVHLVPDAVKTQFSWPSGRERQEWLERRLHTPIAIPHPSEQLGTRWDFFRVFESIEESEYAVVSCELVDSEIAEITIDPWGYPYGGVGPLIALAEAYGFTVLGINECGRYETREELRRRR